MFGVHQFPLQIDIEGISLSIEPYGNYSEYIRKSEWGCQRKIIAKRSGRVVINPVEPLNIPEDVTGLLELHFTPVALEPDARITIYLKFPVEIGVFLEGRDDYDILDIFSLASPKYSLYGAPDKGFITRHMETDVYDHTPITNPYQEGVMVLTIHNAARNYVEVSRAIFEQSTMHIFYGLEVVMKAEMEVFSRLVAETRILEKPPEEEMKQSVRLFTAKRSLIPEKPTFLMEYGVGE